MKVYLAGSPGLSAMKEITCRQRLHTFFRLSLPEIELDHSKGIETAIDSGAFSAWSLDAPIKLEDYMDFLQGNEGLFSWYANLDVIEDPSKSGKSTWENQREMERNGLSPTPVFHFQEDPKWIKKYLDNHEFIAIGGMVEIPNAQLYSWLDDMFTKYLTDDKGMPRAKFHGFGWTTPVLVSRYPWYSVDSSTWVKISGLGQIMVPPEKKGGGYDFTKPPKTYDIFLAPSDPKKNIWMIPEKERSRVVGFIESRGLKLGESEIVWWPRDKELPSNGQTINKHRPINDGNLGAFFNNTDKLETHQPIEVVEVAGVSNNLIMRRQIIAEYYMAMEDHFEWPRLFKYKKQFQGRFFT